MDTATHPITSHTPDAIRAVPATQTLTVAAVFHLTEVGRKASLLAGGDGLIMGRFQRGYTNQHRSLVRSAGPERDARRQIVREF